MNWDGGDLGKKRDNIVYLYGLLGGKVSLLVTGR